jgi:hypothetical protein
MLDTIAKFDVALVGIIFLEGCTIFWLLPLGVGVPLQGTRTRRLVAPPGYIRKQRIGRFLLPLVALLCFSVFFLPPSISPATIAREYVVVALTPAYAVLAVFGAVGIVRAWGQRRRIVRARRQLHRQRQGML